jgi:hypothetical protein
LQNYEDELYCSNCGNDKARKFNYIRTVNGKFIGTKSDTRENLVGKA